MDAGPELYHLADWRRRISELYAEVRKMPDPARARAHWLAVRSEMYRAHPQSPLPRPARADFHAINAYEYEPALRFSVELVAQQGPELVADLGGDGQMRYAQIARTEGLAAALGSELPVFWIQGYGGGLYLPFSDATSGDETYGGGRYLADAIKGSDLGLAADGRMIIDFNFAYHPSCAHNPDFICPLPGPECRLACTIRAGERL